MTTEQAFGQLGKSTVRQKFHLSAKDKGYINDKEMETIGHHADYNVKMCLTSVIVSSDGKQTLMREQMKYHQQLNRFEILIYK